MRVGQVSGSKRTGAWNISDWVPILVKSSLAVGCLPDMDGVGICFASGLKRF